MIKKAAMVKTDTGIKEPENFGLIFMKKPFQLPILSYAEQ